MDLVQIIVLAIVQGLTEFLPISSTAHLRIVPALLGWSDPGAAFSAVLQIGTLAAVVTYFRRDVLRIARSMFAAISRGQLIDSQDARMGWMIVVGTLPIVVCGLAFKDHIKTTLRSLEVMCGALVVVGILLAAGEFVVRRRKYHGREGRGTDQVGWRDSIIIGLAQAAALVPGTSRSGSTIFGGLCCGLTREAAARFSFLLSIPSILAAGVYQLVEAREELGLASPIESAKLGVGLLVTAAVGYATIPWLLAFLRRRSTFVFVAYRLVLAATIIALLASGHLTEH
jgi:undecaprenyl-diphosphatase